MTFLTSGELDSIHRIKSIIVVLLLDAFAVCYLSCSLAQTPQTSSMVPSGGISTFAGNGDAGYRWRRGRRYVGPSQLSLRGVC